MNASMMSSDEETANVVPYSSSEDESPDPDGYESCADIAEAVGREITTGEDLPEPDEHDARETPEPEEEEEKKMPPPEPRPPVILDPVRNQEEQWAILKRLPVSQKSFEELIQIASKEYRHIQARQQ